MYHPNTDEAPPSPRGTLVYSQGGLGGSLPEPLNTGGDSPITEASLPKKADGPMTSFTMLFNRYQREVFSLSLVLTRSQTCLAELPVETATRQRRQQERLIISAIREHQVQLQALFEQLRGVTEGK
jgi:hypothetical protein